MYRKICIRPRSDFLFNLTRKRIFYDSNANFDKLCGHARRKSMNSKTFFYEMKELSELLSKPPEEKIILCDKLTSVQVLSICSDKQADHVVQKSNVEIERELKLSYSATQAPDLFIKYPLSVIMGEENPSEETEKEKLGLSFFLSTPDDKDTALEKLEEYIGQYCKRQSVVADIRLCADELVSNSLFNAPYVNKENSNANVERDYSKISIDATRKPHIFAGFHQNRILMGCTDFYGRLNISKLIDRIKLCYINNPGQMINYEAGGAGIGSYMVFDSCMSYYVAVDPDKSSTICCSFPVNMSAKERSEVPKNVHIILSQNSL